MAAWGFVAMIPTLCAVPWLVWLGLHVRAALAQMEVFNPLPWWALRDAS